jgi:hypothetical protein
VPETAIHLFIDIRIMSSKVYSVRPEKTMAAACEGGPIRPRFSRESPFPARRLV